MKLIFKILLLSTLSISFLNAQNVGIGTSNPKAKLHVKSDQGLVSAFYEGFNEGVINPAYHEGDNNWKIITDDPPVGAYGAGAPSSIKNNETAILNFTINTPIGKNIRIEFNAFHNDPNSDLAFTVVKPGGIYYIDHNPSWRSYSTNFIATSNTSIVKFRLEADQDVQFAETFLDEIKVTYLPDPVLMIEDGTQMSGGILQSDAFGNTSWVDLRSEIGQQITGAAQELSFNTTTNKLSIENGNNVSVSGLSNSASKYLSLSMDTILSSPGMQFNIPAIQEGQSAFHYNASRSSMAWGVAPVSNSYIDAQHSVRWGSNNKVYAEHGSVWGLDNIITFTGKNATVFGKDNSIAGFGSTAWGNNNNVEADSFGTVWGLENLVSGKYGTAWGYNNIASNIYTTAFGYESTAEGANSLAAGYEAEALGNYSISLGNFTNASSYGEIALGYNNYRTYTYSASSWDDADMLFSIGNGYDYDYSGVGHNALSILKNGNIGINTHDPEFQLDILTNDSSLRGIRIENEHPGLSSGSILKFEGQNQLIQFQGHKQKNNFTFKYTESINTLFLEYDDTNFLTFIPSRKLGIHETNPTYDLHLGNNSAAKPSSSSWIVASDRRLKQNIKPFEGGLDLVQKINPVWFTYNGRAALPQETSVGTIAQELESVAPYMVTEWEREGETYKAVDYGAMDFILVNAIKEQQEQIKKLMEIVEKQGKLIEELHNNNKKSVVSN